MKRETLVFVGFVSFSAMTSAAPCVDIAESSERLTCYDEAQRCGAIREDELRLQCYDREFAGRAPAAEESTAEAPMAESERAGSQTAESQREQTVQVAPTPEYSRPPAPPSAPAPAAAAENSFGMPSAAEAEGISGTIIETQTDARGVDYFRLANGQVWRETRDYKVRIEEGQSVRIDKGALNSYNLRSDTINKLVKVRRVN